MLAHIRVTAIGIALFALLAALLTVGSNTAEAVGENSGGVFVPVTPARIADTTTGTNTSAVPLASGGVRSINVLGVGGIPSTGVGAVVLDVAGSSNAGAAVYAYSDGTTRGGSFLKIDANDGWDSNTVIVKPGTNGKVAFYNSYGSTDINVDVQGYFTDVSGEGSPGGFVPITPSRLVSTGAGTGITGGALKGGTTTHVQVGGVGDIPSNATAIFGNVRVYDSSYSGGVKLLPSEATTGTSTSLNFVTDEFNDSGLSMKLGPDGKIKVIMSGTLTQTAHLIIDVQGYFTPDPAGGGSYTPLTGRRIYNSSDTVSIPANGLVEVPVAGLAGVPDDGTAGSVAMTVMALNWHATGSVRVFNPDEGPTGTTNIAFTAPFDRDVSSTSIISLSNAGEVAIQNLSGGAVDIILDAQGWFSDPDIYEPYTGEEDDPETSTDEPEIVPSPGDWASSTEENGGDTHVSEDEGFSIASGWWDGQCGSNSSTSNRYSIVKTYSRAVGTSRMKGTTVKMYCGRHPAGDGEDAFGLRHVRAGHKGDFQELASYEGRNWGNWMHWALGYVFSDPDRRTEQSATRFCYERIFYFKNGNETIKRRVVAVLGKTGVRIMTTFPRRAASTYPAYCRGPAF